MDHFSPKSHLKIHVNYCTQSRNILETHCFVFNIPKIVNSKLCVECMRCDNYLACHGNNIYSFCVSCASGGAGEIVYHDTIIFVLEAAFFSRSFLGSFVK